MEGTIRAYIVRRLLQTAYVLLALSVVVFVAVRAAPGDPAQARLGREVTREAVEEERRALGLHRPIFIQYGIWLSNTLRGDFGKTISYATDWVILDLVLEKLKRTIPLALSALLLAVVVSIPLGIIAGVRPYTWIDNSASAVALFGVSAPNFWVGLMLILFFSVRLGWFPASGYGPLGEGLNLRHLVLPSIALSIQMMGALTRYMRSGMLDVMTSDYIRTARAKGLPERSVIVRHALKNALLSVVTVFALDLGGLLAGALVTETVFQWPGIGLLLLGAINNRDYGIVQAVVLFTAVIYVMVNLMADIIYGYLDPRIRYG